MSPVDLATLIEVGAATPAQEALYMAFVILAGAGIGALIIASGMGARDAWKRFTR